MYIKNAEKLSRRPQFKETSEKEIKSGYKVKYLEKNVR